MCSLKGERATGSNHKMSLITVRSSFLRHLLGSLASTLTLLSPSDFTSLLSPRSSPSSPPKIELSSLQPMVPLPLHSSACTNPTSVHCLITVRQLHAWHLPPYNLVGRGYKLTSFRENFPFHPSSSTTENGSTHTFHPSTTETCT